MAMITYSDMPGELRDKLKLQTVSPNPGTKLLNNGA
jgi:hypothetical protein